MRIAHSKLKDVVHQVFAAAGCQAAEAERIAHYLVGANLVGHDSHGVIRVPIYIDWLRSGKVVANQSLQVVLETESLAVVDGQFGFGQVIGEQAVRLGIAKAAKQGVSVVALRNCGHLGRIGDWPTMAADAGLISLHFVNTSGLGLLVSPIGGINRRLSANPLAAGIPVPGKPPILLDISTCSIAEGKIKVAFNKGVPLPDGCIIDAQGRPTNDPKVFYANPPGAILPFGGHKGYALAVITEIFAGAVTGNGCSTPGVTRLSNGMLSIYLDPARLQPADAFHAEVAKFVAFVRSSELESPDAEILLPGDPEERTRAKRMRDGIELDDKTWGQICDSCRLVGVEAPVIA